MRRVGTVVRTAGGLAIARGDAGNDPPRIGASIVDESLSTVGRVVDVFGPIDRPYVAITPGDGVGLADLLGEKLYAR
ncbi:Gar1/Naf1 family protein [Halorubrum ezzemoulense]|uniref:H/ACA RNA-protein complex component Gar1 n=1 Tax=Halorubrum ezzemoulense TaxID=337243 RepID=A0A256JMD3_HALEZ|nr:MULTISPECIES: Gar1/Naf1 family protein [Halorubrum]MDB2236588.1 Gar1/Naf1 family protein [Halorubrum ezzemoulense]MDB2241055.1 Gar1/Naf1 family protein [Halorubrum ezzemoulense]MDB2248124.1 Gar1/Naf1 family protein [Halorubrum ezzemoulense]MDB2273523.1 Gar1/Naf1 family protein [Halorubrum ezzemoulense]MDB2281980.1 Gar1/Naf1 family protein [Halorubrum ezzemoulense]